MKNKTKFTWPVPEGYRVMCDGRPVEDLQMRSVSHPLKSEKRHDSWTIEGRCYLNGKSPYDLYLEKIEDKEPEPKPENTPLIEKGRELVAFLYETVGISPAVAEAIGVFFGNLEKTLFGNAEKVLQPEKRVFVNLYERRDGFTVIGTEYATYEEAISVPAVQGNNYEETGNKYIETVEIRRVKG